MDFVIWIDSCRCSDLDFHFTFMRMWEKYVRFLVCLKPCHETNSMYIAYYLKGEIRICKQCRNDNTTTKMIFTFSLNLLSVVQSISHTFTLDYLDNPCTALHHMEKSKAGLVTVSKLHSHCSWAGFSERSVGSWWKIFPSRFKWPNVGRKKQVTLSLRRSVCIDDIMSLHSHLFI